ncbi:DNA alkylation repair protein [Sulfurimonas sp.]|uniref:DNA alkylation repair protein n=1 Tax=Sulfurimonas sp. TaxID=2022749 RepID=UPI003567BB48
MSEDTIVKYLKSISNDEVAKVTKSFFKTNKGQYSHGDIFLGIKVPDIRKAIKKFPTASLIKIEMLLSSKYHEVRHFALLYMVGSFSKAVQKEKDNIYNIYLKNTKHINNWDLVDCSAHHIVGSYLEDKDKETLYKLALSNSLWERRIAIVSTFYFIKQNSFDHTLKIAEMLLNDQEDLIHKAVGWMLREVGKKDEALEKTFLDKHAKKMPRVMLRYAVERFAKEDRKFYLNL